MNDQPRQPKGRPIGGEFAGRDRADSGVELGVLRSDSHFTQAALWRSDGQVDVTTMIFSTGELGRFIIPESAYVEPGGKFGQVINPERYVRTSDAAEAALRAAQRATDLFVPGSQEKFPNDVAAVPAVAAALVEYNTIMAELNPGRWANGRPVDGIEWDAKPLRRTLATDAS